MAASMIGPEVKYSDDCLDLTVVQSGSHGNMSIVNDDIVIDLGVGPVKAETFIGNAHHILITHRHTDHINLSAVRRLEKSNPLLVKYGLYVNEETFQHIKRNAPAIADIMRAPRLRPDMTLTLSRPDGEEYIVRTYPLKHDVENQGFIIELPCGKTLVHATDTSTMEHCPDELFDYILVEGNYDADRVVEDLLSEDSSVAFRAACNLRHLSIQARDAFIRSHSKPGSVAWQLHRSAKFGYPVSPETT